MKKEQAKYKISPKGKRKLDFPKKSKSTVKLPLISKTVYLDVKDVKCTRKLETDLRKLGATIEEFLSKDINYLITSQPHSKVRRDPDDLSPTPSPFNCDPSPSPGSVDDKKLSTVTRGRAIAEKARIQTKSTSTLLDNAEKWGVKIVTLEVAFKWIDKELKKLPKNSQNIKDYNVKVKSGISHHKTFKAPFLKIEADTHIYRPFTSQLEAWPRLNVDTPRGSCPFDGTLIAQGDRSREERGELLAAQVDVSTPDTPQEEKDDIASGARTHTKSVDKSVKKSESDVFGSSRLLTAGELRRQREQKRRQERKRGYCECCHVKYEDLDKHVRDDQHREYVRDKSHFEHLDRLIKTAPSPANFLKNEKMKALQQISRNRSPSEDEEEILLIPTTPKVKLDDVQKDVKISPHTPLSVKGKSPNKKTKSPDVHVRKLTPSANVKGCFRVTKVPKQIKAKSLKTGTSPNQSSIVTSPRTRSGVNSTTPAHVTEKLSPQKTPNNKYEAESRSKSPSISTSGHTTKVPVKNASQGKAVESKTRDEESPVKLAPKSPCRSHTKLEVRSPVKKVQHRSKVRKSINYGKIDSFSSKEPQGEREVTEAVDTEITLKESKVESHLKATAYQQEDKEGMCCEEGNSPTLRRSSRLIIDKEQEKKEKDKITEINSIEIEKGDSAAGKKNEIITTGITENNREFHDTCIGTVRSGVLIQNNYANYVALNVENKICDQDNNDSLKANEKGKILTAFEQFIESGKGRCKQDKSEHINGSDNKSGLNALSHLGEKQTECKSSSDDFEKCILNAISHGDLMFKKVSENTETDRVLRSRNSMGLQDSVETGVQADKHLSNIDQKFPYEVNDINKANKALNVLQCSDQRIINENETNLSLTHSKATGDVTKEQTEIGSKFGNKGEETCDFALPPDLMEEVLFTPTLAERVKTRTRCGSVNSYSPVRSRSNSLSSNKSDSSTIRKNNNLAANVLLNRAKTQLQQEKTHLRNQSCKKTLTSNGVLSETGLSKQKEDSSTVTESEENSHSQLHSPKESRILKLKENKSAFENAPKNSKHDKSKLDKKLGHESYILKVNEQALQDPVNALNPLDNERLSRSRNKKKETDSYVCNSRNRSVDPNQKLNNSELLKNNLKTDIPKGQGKKNYEEMGELKSNVVHGSGNETVQHYKLITTNQINETEHKQPTSKNNHANEGILELPKTNSASQNLEIKNIEKGTKVNRQKVSTGSASPVFPASPVSKRRKGKSCSIKKIADDSVDTKTHEKDKTSQTTSRSLASSGLKACVKNTVSETGKDKSSKPISRAVRISRAIRESILENTLPSENKTPGSGSADMSVSHSDSDECKDDVTQLKESVNRKELTKPTTPNCKKTVPSSCYGSGYSSTPRSERRKAWKRKKAAEKGTASQTSKRRKLDKLKFIIKDNASTSETVSSDTLTQRVSPRKSAKMKLNLAERGNLSHKTDSPTNHSQGDTHVAADCLTVEQKETLSREKKESNNSVGTEGHEKKLGSNENFSLKWECVTEDRNKVKLNKSWSLLSNRSVNKLLSSEDGRESFDGFTEEDMNTNVSLASDMSYEECWEVDKSINSEREFEVDIVEKKTDEMNKEEFDEFLPMLSSPGKRSDSSWVDACEVYIDKSVKSTEKLVFKGWTSPRKKTDEMKDREIENSYMSPKKSPRTPRRNKRVEHPVGNSVFDRQKIDMDIEFYYRSPQKNRCQFSPLRVKNGKVVDTSSPHCITSTPTRQIKYNKDT